MEFILKHRILCQDEVGVQWRRCTLSPLQIASTTVNNFAPVRRLESLNIDQRMAQHCLFELEAPVAALVCGDIVAPRRRPQ
jgi:hypothetical protein